MKLRILKPTPVVPYVTEIPTDAISDDGKPVMTKIQRGRSYGPTDDGAEDVAVEIDEAIAGDWIKKGIAEDFSRPRANGKKVDAKKVDAKKVV